MNVKRYTINYTKFVRQRIPLEMRLPAVIALVVIVVSPAVFVYNLLLVFRDLALYNLLITPQVVYMEKMLNDRYDTAARRIYIQDGLDNTPIYLYQKAEGKPPLFLYQKSEVGRPIPYLRTRGESSSIKSDFTVYVPLDIVFDLPEMKSKIDYFKLPSKFYTIIRF